MRRAATPKRKDSARVLAPFSMALRVGEWMSTQDERTSERARGKGNVLGLGQGSDVVTCGFTEDVGPEGDFGRVHFLSEGDTNGAKGFVSFFFSCVRARVVVSFVLPVDGDGLDVLFRLVSELGRDGFRDGLTCVVVSRTMARRCWGGMDLHGWRGWRV